MAKSIYSLPISFSVKNEVTNKDTRFLEVEIDVLHLGENYNQSIFRKEVVEENIDTIKNTPILGFIRELPNNEKDFKGHEYVITKTDEEGWTRRYLGSAFGVIPESCTPKWVEKMSEDGQVREYLRVNGILWTKFSESIDIMKRDIDKPHSMELFQENIEGHENADGLFVFERFSFDGCCILGSTDDIQPAMISSNIKIKDSEIDFTMSDFVASIQGEINNKFEIFTALKTENEINQGGIKDMPIPQFSDISAMVNQQETFTNKFEVECPRYYTVDVSESEIIVVDRMDDYNYYGLSYIINDDNKAEIDFEKKKKKKICYEDCVEEIIAPEGSFSFGQHISEIEELAFAKIEEANTKISEFETAKNEIEVNYNQIKAEFDEMRPKYDDYVKAEQARIAAELDAQKDAEFAKYESVLTDNVEFEALKEKKAEMTVKEIESECAILYARKNLALNNFSKSNDGVMTAGLIKDSDDVEGLVKTKYGFIHVRR